VGSHLMEHFITIETEISRKKRGKLLAIHHSVIHMQGESRFIVY
jgi:hypothetical protein